MFLLLLLFLLPTTVSSSLPQAPPDAVKVGETSGFCDALEVVITDYLSPTKSWHFRYSHSSKTFAVGIPPLVYALRGDGAVVVFNQYETDEDVCSTLEKFLKKAI